jgi:hypothetical protein
MVDGTKEMERPKMKVENSYVDRVNGSSDTSGKIFVINKAATEEWRSASAEHVEEVKDAAEKAKLGLTDIAEALINKANDAPKKTRRTKAEMEADANKKD